MLSSKIFTKNISTPIGEMIGAATDDGICLLEFAERENLQKKLKELSKHFKAKISEQENEHLKMLERQLEEYFKGKRKKFDLHLITPGTDFQKKVWDNLLKIPFGTTSTYKKQSIKLNNLKGIRAVAKANGSNRIAIIIPCHRVIGENGNLTGYAGGLWRKKWLLDFESEMAGKGKQKDLFEIKK